MLPPLKVFLHGLHLHGSLGVSMYPLSTFIGTVLHLKSCVALHFVDILAHFDSMIGRFSGTSETLMVVNKGTFASRYP